MGKRTGTVAGVEVRDTSIRLRFTVDGEVHKPTIRDASGKPIQPNAGNIRAAERLIVDVKAAIRLGTFRLGDFFPEFAEEEPKKEIPTLGRQLDTWLAGLKVAKSTRAGYESAARFWRLAPANDSGTLIADVPINEIVFSQIRHALAVGGSRQRRGKIDSDNPAKPLSAKTSNNYLQVIRAALELAFDDELIAKNPSGSGDKLRSKVQKARPDPFSLEELELILARIRAKSAEAGDYADFWAFTGMRTSELNGLHWPDVDLRKSSVRVHRVNVRGEDKSTTKTDEERDVPLDATARAALERQRARTHLAGAHVWINPQDGAPWNDERDFRRSHWTPALKALGIRYRRPYNLRHTRATMLLKAGVSPALAAKWLGHSLQMFFQRYAKWIDDARDVEELKKMDALMATSGG